MRFSQALSHPGTRISISLSESRIYAPHNILERNAHRSSGMADKLHLPYHAGKVMKITK
jgi:hypothetical protein